MRMRLIMNPGSRSGKGRQLWSLWQSALASEGVTFDSVITECAGHAVELARDSMDYDTVVAVGGDGTINAVLDGIMQSRRNNHRMGILYSGTSPDFCRFHGVPVSPREAVSALVAGKTERVDVARIVYTSKNGQEAVSHFGCGGNIGLGPAVARASNRIRGSIGDTMGTCLALIHAIAKMEPVDLDLYIDGAPVQLLGVNNLSILKSPFIASGLQLNLPMSATDGRLAAFAVHGRNRLSILNILPGFYTGKAVARNDVFYQSCSRISIQCRKQTEIEFDGDPRGFLPAEIEILPRMLNLIGYGQ